MNDDAQRAILAVFVTPGTMRLCWGRLQAECLAEGVSQHGKGRLEPWQGPGGSLVLLLFLLSIREKIFFKENKKI